MTAVSDRAVEPARAAATLASLSGADLLGRSMLPLLADANGRDATWLFVMSATQAWLSQGPLGDACFVRAPADYSGTWPLGDGTVGGVVIDGDPVAGGAGDAALRRILSEATRVSGGNGNVVLLCGHRVVPRRLWAWREYRRPSEGRWRRAARESRLQANSPGFARVDGDRLSDVVVATSGASAPRDVDRVVLRVTRSGRHGDAAVAAMVADAAGIVGGTLRIDRIAVRKIGKTAVFLSGGDGRRYIMRIARSPMAHARAERNFSALEAVHRSALPAFVTGAVPAPVARRTLAGFPYFLETCLDGRSGPVRGKAGLDGWELEAVTYISTLHQATASPSRMSDELLDRLVRQPFARVMDACTSPAADRLLTRALNACETALRGQVVPLVRSHGDFTESNCLFDAAGRLTAVVDWELSCAQALPLLDLLQLMPVPGEVGSHPRWQRFDAWLDLWRAPARVASDPVMGTYMRALRLPLQTIPALILLQWVTHVADRIHVRRDDERWMRQRVHQPLESLGRTFCE